MYMNLLYYYYVTDVNIEIILIFCICKLERSKQRVYTCHGLYMFAVTDD